MMKSNILTVTDILKQFNNTTFQRGYNYYTDGYVETCKVIKVIGKKRAVKILSVVEGSYNYTQNIDISNGVVNGDCSCPVGYNCKHVVAALFYTIHEKDLNKTLKEESPIDIWINEFKALQVKEPENFIAQNDYFLIYRLFMEDSKSNQLNFYKAKILKNGNLSKGTKLSNDNYLYSYNHRYDFINDLDKKLAYSLESILDGYRGDIVFNGEYGNVLLKRIIATNRCFFKDSSVPLKMTSQKKILTFEWKEKNGLSWMEPNLSKDEQLLPNITPPLSINTKLGDVQEVETSYNSATLKFLFDAPKFPSQAVHGMVQKILEELPEVDFPLPKEFEIVTLEIEPINHLHLYGKVLKDKKVIHIMQLSFDYEGNRFKSTSQSTTNIISKNNKIIKVKRDIDREYQARKVLEELGFSYESNILVEGYISRGTSSLQEAIERWRIFTQEVIPTLIEQGWQIDIDESFKYKFEYVDSISLETQSGETNDWFSLSFAVQIGDRKLELLPIVLPLLKEFDSVEELPPRLNLELEDGGFLHIESKEVKPILKTIFELFDKKEGNNLLIQPFDAHLLDIDANVEWKGAKELRELAQKLRDFKGITTVKPSVNLQAKLREYQEFGLSWLNFLHEFKFGGILADDMGLGKTIQTLAFLQILKERGELNRPSLIVMPTSLIGNWKNEIKKFTPNLTFLELYGIDRAKKFADIEKYDIILTTYSLAQRDEEKYQKEHFTYIILDEAQKIKNPNTKLSVAIKTFKSDYKLALSGTPIENHLGELWSIFDFLMNGFLDNLKTFKSFFQTPIEKEYDMTKRELLNRKIAPFILRRNKNEVVHELPPKTEIIKRATFDSKQAKLYENIRVTMESKVREAVKEKGLSRSHITILDALLKLRQVCCHPQILKLDAAKKVKHSVKFEMFLELIETLHEEGKKVLVFSQFSTMLSLMEQEIKKRKYTYTKLIGSTRKREEAIEKFTKGDANIFLISLKAGGVGLNLVEADTVIHYDPWWNPAVENQATDRAYRIGQDKAVFVYKLIVENSIEEKIIQLQERKKLLQAGIYKGNEKKQDKFDGNELVELLSI